MGNYERNKNRERTRSEVGQIELDEKKRKTERDQSRYSEEEQKQLQNTEMLKLLQDLREKIDSLGNREPRAPNRS